MRGGRFYVCPFFGSFLGVREYDDLHASNKGKFDKTVELLESAPKEHMVVVASDTPAFQAALSLLLGYDLPIAWKSERAEHDADWQVILAAEAKAEAADKVGLRRTVHPPHPSIAKLHVRWPSAPEALRNPPICRQTCAQTRLFPCSDGRA